MTNEEMQPIPPGPRRTRPRIPDQEFYAPLFSPWNGYGDFADYYGAAKDHTLVSADRCYLLLSLARQARQLPGCWVECGVYRGGTAILLAKVLANYNSNTSLHLFDTFQGMPAADPSIDFHQRGDFADTTLEGVRNRVLTSTAVDRQRLFFHAGTIPESFEDAKHEMGSQISLAHIDVDIYQSVLDCCEFVYPRLVPSGFLLFDDYGFPSCAGARKAVDEYFTGKSEVPVVLPTGQALIFRVDDSSVHGA